MKQLNGVAEPVNIISKLSFLPIAYFGDGEGGRELKKSVVFNPVQRIPEHRFEFALWLVLLQKKLVLFFVHSLMSNFFYDKNEIKNRNNLVWMKFLCVRVKLKAYTNVSLFEETLIHASSDFVLNHFVCNCTTISYSSHQPMCAINIAKECF